MLPGHSQGRGRREAGGRMSCHTTAPVHLDGVLHVGMLQNQGKKFKKCAGHGV
jgi:hypothetical protein